MKRITILFLLFLSSAAVASDFEIEQYVDARILMNQTEVDQLREAINLLHKYDLTEQEKFEHIGQPSFDAVDLALAQMGYTLQSYLRFEENHAAEMDQWLVEHPWQAEEIDALESEKELLIEEYDLLIKPTTAAIAN